MVPIPASYVFTTDVRTNIIRISFNSFSSLSPANGLIISPTKEQTNHNNSSLLDVKGRKMKATISSFSTFSHTRSDQWEDDVNYLINEKCCSRQCEINSRRRSRYASTTVLMGFILTLITLTTELQWVEGFHYPPVPKTTSTLLLPLKRTYETQENTSILFSSRFRSRLMAEDGPSASSSATHKKNSYSNHHQRNSNKNYSKNNKNTKERVNNYNNNHKAQRHNNSMQNQNNNNMSNPLMKAKNLNYKIINCEFPSEVLATFVASGAARGVAGNNEMNSVNFSTSLHRIAKTCSMFRPRNHNNSEDGAASNPPTQKELRSSTLTDPRFAILLCVVSEAFVEKKDIWNCRELSNISWALAKINFVPDADTIPLPSYKSDDSYGREDEMNVNGNTNGNSRDQTILMSAKKLRESVILAGKQQKDGNKAEANKRWISQMRILAAHLLDGIALHTQYELLSNFKSQELANMIWALATVGRGDAVLFDALVKRLLENNSDSEHGQFTKPQELSNSIWAFATSGLSGEGQVELTHFIAESFTNGDEYPNYIDRFKPQELSNTAWGVATLISKREENVFYSPSISGTETDEALTSLQLEEEVSAFKIIRQIATAFLDRINEFKPQEISNTVWAMATIGFADPESPHTLPEDAELLEQVFQKTALDALPRLQRFSPQELNCLGWAFARLGAERNPEVDSLFAGIGEQVQRRIRFFSPQDVGTTLWSFATMGYDDLPHVFHAAASRVTIREAHSFKPQELSNSVWALATVGILPRNPHVFDTTLFPDSKKMLMKTVMGGNDVITECFTAAAIETMKRPWVFKEQELKDVLWSFSKLGIRHPVLFKKIAQHVLGESDNGNFEGPSNRLADFSPQGVGNFVWSYARQAQLSNEPSPMENSSERGQQQSVTSNSSGRLAVYETICLDLGENLVNRLFAAVAESSLSKEDKLETFKPQDLSNTVWAFATLGLLHREFFEEVSEEVVQSVAYHTKSKKSPKGQKIRESFKPQEVANLIWAYATLNCRPKSSIVNTFAPYILQLCASGKKKGSYVYDETSISQKFNRQELANLAWSCAVLEQYPSDLIPLLYTGLIGSKQDDKSTARLTELYNDQGLQKKAIMSLLYVQVALDLEAPHLNLNLPAKLLEIWSDQDNSSDPSDGNSENELMSLNTSRLQKSVSSAFEKIGFQHVQEHVLGSDDLQKHGITLSSSPLNFLSIDIANIAARVGIEVDGPSHFINVLDEPQGSEETNEGSKRQQSNGGKMWLFEWNGQRQVNGPTALKTRLLSHLGWRIIHIPFWEWNNFGDEESQSAYCKKLLDSVDE